jgi:acylphosphatase
MPSAVGQGGRILAGLVVRRDSLLEHRRLEAIVHGWVQGVGFRWHTRDLARRLGLQGYVRNRPDRTVEVVAEGPELALRELLAYLEAGPAGAVVERVDTSWLPSGSRLRGFEVRY